MCLFVLNTIHQTWNANQKRICMLVSVAFFEYCNRLVCMHVLCLCVCIFVLCFFLRMFVLFLFLFLTWRAFFGSYIIPSLNPFLFVCVSARAKISLNEGSKKLLICFKVTVLSACLQKCFVFVGATKKKQIYVQT